MLLASACGVSCPGGPTTHSPGLPLPCCTSQHCPLPLLEDLWIVAYVASCPGDDQQGRGREGGPAQPTGAASVRIQRSKLQLCWLLGQRPGWPEGELRPVMLAPRGARRDGRIPLVLDDHVHPVASGGLGFSGVGGSTGASSAWPGSSRKTQLLPWAPIEGPSSDLPKHGQRRGRSQGAQASV